MTGQKTWIPLALRANRAGWGVADNVTGKRVELEGIAGTAVFKVFDLQVARSGLTLAEAVKYGFDPVENVIKSRSRAHAHPGSSTLHIQMVGDRKSGRLLGAQMVGKEGAAHRIDAVAVALAYRDRLGCQTCYVADLDAIAGRKGHRDILCTLAAEGLALWVDAGVSTPETAQALIDLGIVNIIIGTETLRSTDQLTVLATHIPPQTLILSVDLLEGVLRAPPGIDTPRQLVALAEDVGIKGVILLDLARVGAAAGPPLALLNSLQPHFPDLAFYAGGGVRHRADLDALVQAGAAGALIATAFHRGVLTAGDVEAYQG